MALLGALLPGALSGCSHPAPDRPPDRFRLGPDAITGELAEMVGISIATCDLLAEQAHDLLQARLGAGGDPRALGWLVYPDQDDRWLVVFVGRLRGVAVALHEVRIGRQSPAGELTAVEPPRPLTPEYAAMFRARQTAARAAHRRCTADVNPVVLPAPRALGVDGWLVYLLAAVKSSEVVLAGHDRVLVSRDGGRILSYGELSSTCLRAPAPGSGATLGVSHSIGSQPIETHVYTSLRYRVPLQVTTGKGRWIIRGRKIAPLSVEGGP